MNENSNYWHSQKPTRRGEAVHKLTAEQKRTFKASLTLYLEMLPTLEGELAQEQIERCAIHCNEILDMLEEL